MISLHDIAPRLATARDQLRTIAEERNRYEIWLADERLRLGRLVAHRELQLLRAGTRRNLRYVDKRAGKLEAAVHALESIERHQPTDDELLERAA